MPADVIFTRDYTRVDGSQISVVYFFFIVHGKTLQNVIPENVFKIHLLEILLVMP